MQSPTAPEGVQPPMAPPPLDQLDPGHLALNFGRSGAQVPASPNYQVAGQAPQSGNPAEAQNQAPTIAPGSEPIPTPTPDIPPVQPAPSQTEAPAYIASPMPQPAEVPTPAPQAPPQPQPPEAQVAWVGPASRQSAAPEASYTTVPAAPIAPAGAPAQPPAYFEAPPTPPIPVIQPNTFVSVPSPFETQPPAQPVLSGKPASFPSASPEAVPTPIDHQEEEPQDAPTDTAEPTQVEKPERIPSFDALKGAIRTTFRGLTLEGVMQETNKAITTGGLHGGRPDPEYEAVWIAAFEEEIAEREGSDAQKRAA